jgi:T5SS/PEP-CTERM-associated repeat protein
MRCQFLIAAACLPVILVGATPVLAQILTLYSWDNPSGGSYDSTSNWDSSERGIPDNPNEAARFNVVATYTVDLAADYTVGDLRVIQGNVTFDFETITLFPHYVYTTGGLSVAPTGGGSASLRMMNGDANIIGGMVIGGAGSSGQASLGLDNSDTTTAGAAVGIGSNSVGHMTIDRSSEWSSTGPLVLGGAGDGQLDILAGARGGLLGSSPALGRVANARVVMAEDATSNSAATTYGVWSTGDLIVGDAGHAEVTVLGTQLNPAPGVNVSSVGSLDSATVSVAAKAGSTGSVDIVGFALGGIGNNVPLASSWDISGSLTLGGTSGAPGGAAQLTIGPLNSVSVGSDLKMWSGSKLVLSEDGVLSVTGAANLGGTLEFKLAATPDPQLGNKFEIFSATGGVAGTFESTLLPALDSGLVWDVQYAATSVSIVVVEGLAGDYNNNGTVNAADYVVWRKTNINGEQGYNTWRANFGATLGSGSAISLRSQVAVPEPAGAVLLYLGLAAKWAIARSRK